jgi:hypothetical protein
MRRSSISWRRRSSSPSNRWIAVGIEVASVGSTKRAGMHDAPLYADGHERAMYGRDLDEVRPGGDEVEGPHVRHTAGSADRLAARSL